jgi:hypothetical protein
MIARMWAALRARLPAWWPRVETRPGDVFVAGGMLVTPIARTVSVRAARGGVFLRLSRPVAVTVVAGGKQKRVRIVDATRLAQSLIVLMAIVPVCLVWMWTRTRKEP